MSINKKFVTAITTAGLLAGLFGSAFVPSAFARSSVSTSDSYAFLETEGNAGGGEIAEHAKDDAKDGDEETLGRLQIHSYSIYGVKGSSSDREYGVDSFTDSEDMSIGFVVEDADGDPVNNPSLSATVTGGKVEVSWAYADDGQDYVNQCHDGALDSHFSSTGDTINEIDSFNYQYYGSGYYYLCIKPVGKTTLGTSTITVKANGTTIWSNTVQVIGDLNSLTLSITDGYNRVSGNNWLYGSFFTVIGKDKAGQAINASNDGFYNDLEDWTGNQFDQGDEDVLNSDGDPIDVFYDEDFSSGQQGENVVGLMTDVCVDGDEGASYKFIGQMDSYRGTQIESNEVTLVCTGDADTAVISGVTQEYSSPLLKGDADWAASKQGLADIKSGTGVIDISVTIKDEDGGAMGVDGSTGFGIDFDLAGNSDLGYNEDDSYAIGAGGKLKIAGYEPDMSVAAKFKLTVTIVNPDSNSAIESVLVASLYYQVSSIDSDYSLTRVRNGAKTSATWTADWGLECSNAVVYFDWVNKNGTKGTLVTGTSPIARRADFDGVAKFTLKKRNMTIYVTAYACDDFTDTPDELGPVAARFR